MAIVQQESNFLERKYNKYVVDECRYSLRKYFNLLHWCLMLIMLPSGIPIDRRRRLLYSSSLRVG